MARRLIFKEGGLTGSIPSGYQAIGFNGATFSQLTSAGAFSGGSGASGTSGVNGTSGTSAAGGGGLTRFTEGLSTSAPNATVNVVSLTATASTTNADAVIAPKGTGAFLTAVPDGLTSGGNKRGTNAVDLQSAVRIGNDRVASGAYSAVLGGGGGSRAAGANSLSFNGIADGQYSTSINAGGASNTYTITLGGRATATGYGAVAMGMGFVWSDATASGENALSIGGGNISSGTRSMSIGGEANVASDTGAVSMGGRNNIASGIFSYSFGAYTTTNGVQARQTRGRSLGTVQGETQKSEFFLSVRTTDATATTVTVAGGAASTSNQVILSNQSSYRFKGTIIGKKSGTTDAACWDVDGLITRGANAASTTLNSSTVTLVSNVPGWGGPTLAADTTNGGLQVQVVGTASTNIQWTAVIETTEVIYS